MDQGFFTKGEAVHWDGVWIAKLTRADGKGEEWSMMTFQSKERCEAYIERNGLEVIR